MAVVIGIIIFLLVVGSAIAIAWWNVSARAAPYADEADRRRARDEQARKETEQNTIVIQKPAAPDSSRGV